MEHTGERFRQCHRLQSRPWHRRQLRRADPPQLIRRFTPHPSYFASRKSSNAHGRKFSEIASVIASYETKTYDPAIEQPGFHARTKIRDRIARDVADPESLLGTTADGAALALYGLSMLIKILAEHGSASVKTGLSDAADGQLVALATEFLAKIDDGSIKLTALEKGLANVVADIGSRSTGVARILAEAPSGATQS